MSTRCQIGFYKHEKQALNRPNALLYCGNDGRPGYIMPLLINSLQKLDDDKRLDDIETSSAKVLYDIMHCIEKLCPNSYTAYGISKVFHGDIDYFYAIYMSGFVKAFSIINLGLLCETGKGVRTLKKVNIREAPRETESQIERERSELHEAVMELLTYWRTKNLVEKTFENQFHKNN